MFEDDCERIEKWKQSAVKLMHESHKQQTNNILSFCQIFSLGMKVKCCSTLCHKNGEPLRRFGHHFFVDSKISFSGNLSSLKLSAPKFSSSLSQDEGSEGGKV